ncbi:PREDICTED: migration and invasion-inhibitory protein isoform X1 [Galeopterus variegatus]|uniref:Migration and invasion-inhibitory protein isoform X1 n=1 Tax=Galeopterus variegatus TaxID=482537 RepID=A0ABM0S4Y4_GALVR|nr:PREDICTED: migration and invasion-inhibitory protein isoform X1 [Galeopterus variegatus]
MVETEDPALLRLLSLELLRQLWVGQDAMRRSVALAASESSLDSGSSYDSETPLSPETSSASSGASPRQGKCHVCGPSDAHQGGPYDMASSSVTSLPPANCRHQESPGRPRPHLAPLQATSDSDTPEPSAGQSDLGLRKTQALKSILARQSKLSKPRVTFCKESGVPEKSWRLRPYLGYDWIAGSLDSSSPITSKPEAFFSKLQEFRESNRAECVYSGPEPQLLGLRGSSGVDKDHECVFCYRVNRRLFLVPLDPGTPCRLCRTPRDQRGPETLVEPVQVRVSVPLSILDPPHRYRIHRRKSFDASDTLALPRHCLLGWDILPPKSEKSSAPKCLDLWSSVSSKAQHQKLSAASPSRLALPVRVPPPTPTWSEPQLPQPRVLRQKP